jgi:hypothetical protein
MKKKNEYENLVTMSLLQSIKNGSLTHLADIVATREQLWRTVAWQSRFNPGQRGGGGYQLN